MVPVTTYHAKIFCTAKAASSTRTYTHTHNQDQTHTHTFCFASRCAPPRARVCLLGWRCALPHARHRGRVEVQRRAVLTQLHHAAQRGATCHRHTHRRLYDQPWALPQTAPSITNGSKRSHFRLQAAALPMWTHTVDRRSSESLLDKPALCAGCVDLPHPLFSVWCICPNATSGTFTSELRSCETASVRSASPWSPALGRLRMQACVHACFHDCAC